MLVDMANVNDPAVVGDRTGGCILLVEDDPGHRTALVSALTSRGYAVEAAATGAAAIAIASRREPDLLLLDLGLPDVDGVDLCGQFLGLRNCPVIVVTADATPTRTVRALDMGADDYVTKPFRMDELLARIRRSLRPVTVPPAASTSDLIDCGAVQIDVAEQVVRIDGHTIDMAPRLLSLFVTLARHEGRLFTYAMLLRSAWGEEPGQSGVERLRTAMADLRSILGSGPLRPVIHADSGVGYRLSLPDAV